MTLEQKCGQVLCVGFEGTVIDEEMKSLIRDYPHGQHCFVRPQF